MTKVLPGITKVGRRIVDLPDLWPSAAAAVGTRRMLAGIPILEDFRFDSESLTVVDSGGVNGGWVATKMIEGVPGNYGCIGALLNISVESVGAGINAGGSVGFGMGTGAATTGSISGTAANLGASLNVTLSGGAGSGTSQGPPISTFVVAGTTPDIYLNIGVSDANISANAAVVFSGTCRLFLLDLRGL